MKKPAKLKITFSFLRRLVGLLLFLICFHHSFAAIDISTLEKQLSRMQEDTAKVNVLLKLGEHYCSIENEKALGFLQEAYTISTSKSYTIGMGKSLLWQGRVYYYKDDYRLGLKYFDKAKSILEKTDEWNDISFIFFGKGEIYKIRGDYIHALEMYKEAIKYAEMAGNETLLSSYYGSIGVVLLNRNDIEKALGYFKKSIAMKEAIDDQKGISNILTCMGLTYERLGKLDSSLFYHKKALEIRISLEMDRAIAGSEYNIGNIQTKLENYIEAEEALNIALNNFSALEEKTGMIITKLQLAKTHNRQGKSDAIEIAEEALTMASNIDNPNLISHAYKVLSELYYTNNNYKSSYDYLKKHKTIQDSLFNTEKERILTEIEEEFQSELKDREIASWKDKSRVQQNNNILLIILSIVLLGLLILFISMLRYKSTAFKRQQRLLEQDNIIRSQESKLIEKENTILQEQLESKNRELAAKALEMLRLNETISSIISKLEEFNHSAVTNPEMVKHIKEIIHDLENQTKQNIWNEFDKIFKNIHSDFYSKLLQICPDLTATEIKTAALLKLNLTTKEIAAIAFKSEGGVKTTRYRLRKKLGLTGDEKLIPFLMQI
ncbi:MAG: tetratricopeptide repeat protein [Bacteroidetes bacterium]|nr:tetratricopeptide repeat protein [Bacteroidota bacterium]